ncbi:DnaJ (Hsp40), sub A, member 4 [Branchiostoma belcheri]|nr:DnaJ (Hsp40), sub A, member 4 [Branchiostoma belcheri]
MSEAFHRKRGSQTPGQLLRAQAHMRLGGATPSRVDNGSIIFVISCHGMSGLRELWMNYNMGNMEPFFQNLLALDGSPDTGNGDKELDIEINEEDFYACRQHLLLTHAHAKGFRVVKAGNARSKACTPMGLSEDYPVYCKPLKYNTTCLQLDYLDPAVFTSQAKYQNQQLPCLEQLLMTTKNSETVKVSTKITLRQMQHCWYIVGQSRTQQNNALHLHSKSRGYK